MEALAQALAYFHVFRVALVDQTHVHIGDVQGPYRAFKALHPNDGAFMIPTVGSSHWA